jgi:hypothetical protein
MLNRYQWFGLIPTLNDLDDPFNFAGKTSMYWKLKPEKYDWAVLIMMSILDTVNQMFSNQREGEVDKLQEECTKSFKKNYKRLTYYMQRVQNIIKGLIIYALMVFMVFIHKDLETNIINWIFFSLNMINLALIIRGTSTMNDIKQSLKIVNIIKVYSLTVLILIILFISLIGELPKVDIPDSLDQKFARAYPKIYGSLDLIGLRSNEITYGGDIFKNKDIADKKLSARFVGYTEFFLISIYLSYHFTSLLRQKEADSNFTEQDYKKLFEWNKEIQDQDNSKDSA